MKNIALMLTAVLALALTAGCKEKAVQSTEAPTEVGAAMDKAAEEAGEAAAAAGDAAAAAGEAAAEAATEAVEATGQAMEAAGEAAGEAVQEMTAPAAEEAPAQ